jgi:hypothetical protein
VNHFVPFREVFSAQPLQGIDYDLHIGQVYRVINSLARWGHSWSYDVQLLAGQPEGTITDAGSKGWELWSFALTWLGVPRSVAFNSFVALIMLSAPFLVALAGRTFRLSGWACLIAAAMSSTLWFFDSQLHWMWFVGMISWTGASCWALVTLAVFYRFVETPVWRWSLLAAAGLSTSLLIHPYTFVVLAPPMIVLYGRAFRKLPAIAHVQVAAIGVSAIALNAYWLHNAARHWHYILNSAFYAQAHVEYLLCDYFDVLCNGADSGVIGTRTGFRILYFGMAVAGLVMLRKERDDRVVPLFACLVPLLIIAYFGEFIPNMQQTQPYRQTTPAMLGLTLPAAMFVARTLSRDARARLSRNARYLLAGAAFSLVQLLLATQVLYYFPEIVPAPALHPDGSLSPLSAYGYVSHPDLPVHVSYRVPHIPILERGFESIIQWLEAHAQPGDRVLIDNSVMGERVAWRTKLEVLGGFFERNIEHVDANYFRRYRTRAASPPAIAQYLKTYAVQWVVTARPEFRESSFVAEAYAGEVESVYRTNFPVDRVLKGGGRVTASQNLIQVQHSNPNQTLVLAYHYHEALRCKPDCRVEREPVAIDRVGFIRVPAPHAATLTIWNSYRW